MRKVSAMAVRDRLGQLLEEVYYKGDAMIIERAGRPMAVLVPPAARWLGPLPLLPAAPARAGSTQLEAIRTSRQGEAEQVNAIFGRTHRDCPAEMDSDTRRPAARDL